MYEPSGPDPLMITILSEILTIKPYDDSIKSNSKMFEYKVNTTGSFYFKKKF